MEVVCISFAVSLRGNRLLTEFRFPFPFMSPFGCSNRVYPGCDHYLAVLQTVYENETTNHRVVSKLHHVASVRI